MKTALEELAEINPDDTSGSMASNRYSYQVNWALKKLLELEMNPNQNYVILLDYHDDIVVVDKSSDDEKIDFYQIKTKDGDTWTVSDLYYIPSRKDGNDGHSIIGKLLKHSIDFTNARAYYFVTNSYFVKSQLKDPSLSRASSLEISNFKNEKELKLKGKIAKELPNISEEILNNFHIRQNEIPGDYKHHIKSMLADFIDSLDLKDVTISVGTFYEHLMDEIIRKQNKEGIISDSKEIAKAKGITSEGFKKQMKEIADNKFFDVVVNEISNQLEKEGISFIKKNKLLKPIREEVHDSLFDYNHSELIALKTRIRNTIQTTINEIEDENISFSNFSKLVFDKIKVNYENTLQFKDEFILALIMYYYGKGQY